MYLKLSYQLILSLGFALVQFPLNAEVWPSPPPQNQRDAIAAKQKVATEVPIALEKDLEVEDEVSDTFQRWIALNKPDQFKKLPTAQQLKVLTLMNEGGDAMMRGKDLAAEATSILNSDDFRSRLRELNIQFYKSNWDAVIDIADSIFDTLDLAKEVMRDAEFELGICISKMSEVATILTAAGLLPVGVP